MIYAGYLVSQGTFGFVAAVLVGSVANLVGSWIAWAAGAYGVDAVLVRGDHARDELARTQRLFDRYGGRVVFFARMVPLVRTFVSLPAGMARMPLGRFSLFTFLGCLPWCIGLVAIGNYAGSNWQQWEHRLGYLNYLIVAAVIVLAGYCGDVAGSLSRLACSVGSTHGYPRAVRGPAARDQAGSRRRDRLRPFHPGPTGSWVRGGDGR